MPNYPGELLIPPSVKGDKKAVEMVRAWTAHGGLHCSINVPAWRPDKESIGWGILLSDICRHVADALHKDRGLDKDSAIRQIRTVFNDELDSPTEEVKGDFVR